MMPVLRDKREETVILDGTSIQIVAGYLVLENKTNRSEKRIGLEPGQSSLWIDCENCSILLEFESGRTVNVLYTKEEFEKFFKSVSSREWGDYFFFLRYSF